MASDDDLMNLYLSYYRDMLHLACMYLKNLHDAEDVVGDCWVSLIIHREKLASMDTDEARAYLMRCVSNASIDVLRKKKRQAEWMAQAKKAAEARICILPEEQTVDRLMMEAFYEILPWREAEVFDLRMQGRSFPAIAKELGICPSTARGYWWRVRRKLKRLIGEAYG